MIGDGLLLKSHLFCFSIDCHNCDPCYNIRIYKRSSRKSVSEPCSIIYVSGILIFLGCIPGMPHFIFLSMGGVLALISYFLKKSQRDTAAIEAGLQEKLQQKRTETLRAKSWTGHTLNRLIKLVWKLVTG